MKKKHVEVSVPSTLVVHTHRGVCNRRVGTIAAFKDQDAVVRIGYAKCHWQKDDFNNQHGIDLALCRAFMSVCAPGMVAKLTLPSSMEEDMKKFIGRATRFFKTDKFVVVGMEESDVVACVKAFKKTKPAAKIAG
jgi:hypothetical protein